MNEFDTMNAAEFEEHKRRKDEERIPVKLDIADAITAYGVLYGNLNAMPLCLDILCMLDSRRGDVCCEWLHRRDAKALLNAVNDMIAMFRDEREKARDAGDDNRSSMIGYHLKPLYRLHGALAKILAANRD